MTATTTLAQDLCQRLYGEDPYAGYQAELPPDLQGWNSTHPTLARLVQEGRPRIIMDVGVWKGASVEFFCRSLDKVGGEGAVIAIDTFLGSPEHWNRERPDRIFESLRLRHGLPGLYWQFLSNMVHRGLQGRVVPLAQTSENAAVILRRLNIKADLIHIDAAHEYEPVLRDARLFWGLLNKGGVLVGDDFPWPGVAKAAQDFAAEIGQELVVESPKWILRKPR
ncbi:class I SAM-dependent methyltransferase [Pseudoroseomonas cervicalis]|uniref:class I SAM-dependent methyltransferase n=1 Tax=Teichococcus cervicalis TaxID=204525 RepID=UPI00277F83D8|nr:class I SAM-dependent methyltransferase [Pseudoroseomonas cervicalis]MDQ1081080.1 putative O-methyltransferase YrrM [Pseudoroseomonas cervicalis]